MVMKGKAHTVKLPTKIFRRMKRLQNKYEPNYSVIDRALTALERVKK